MPAPASRSFVTIASIIAVVVLLLGAGVWLFSKGGSVSDRCHSDPRPKIDWANCARAQLLLANSDLTEAILTSAALTGTDLSHAKLARAKLDGTEVSRTRFSDADLSGATLAKAIGWRADFTGANLSNAD